MDHKNTHIAFRKTNLLNELEFILQLKFEAAYASFICGGHFPIYVSARHQKRLVHAASLLPAKELEALALRIANFPN